MKKFSRLFLVLTVMTAMLLSACGAAGTLPSETSSGGNKPVASLIQISGYIEAMDGNQWTVDGKVVTVDESMLNDDDDLSNYKVGDFVEIEAEEKADGSLIALEVDSSDDGNENDDSNSNDDDDSNSNDDDSNSNDDDSNSNDDDDSNSNDDDDSNSNDDDDSNGNDDDDSDGDDDSNENDD